MKEAGFPITTEEWLKEYEQQYERAHSAWRQKIWEKSDSTPATQEGGLWNAYISTPFSWTVGNCPKKMDTDTAVPSQ